MMAVYGESKRTVNIEFGVKCERNSDF